MTNTRGAPSAFAPQSRTDSLDTGTTTDAPGDGPLAAHHGSTWAGL